MAGIWGSAGAGRDAETVEEQVVVDVVDLVDGDDGGEEEWEEEGAAANELKLLQEEEDASAAGRIHWREARRIKDKEEFEKEEIIRKRKIEEEEILKEERKRMVIASSRIDAAFFLQRRELVDMGAEDREIDWDAQVTPVVAVDASSDPDTPWIILLEGAELEAMRKEDPREGQLLTQTALMKGGPE